MWRRGDIGDENSPSFVRRMRVQQCARSGVNIPPMAVAPDGGWGMLKALVRRSDFATAKAPDGEMLLLFASEVCCAVVVLRWTIVLVYARGTYAFSK